MDRWAVVGFAILAFAGVAAVSLLAMASAPPEFGDGFAELALWIVQAAGVGVAVVVAGTVAGAASSGWRAFRTFQKEK